MVARGVVTLSRSSNRFSVFGYLPYRRGWRWGFIRRVCGITLPHGLQVGALSLLVSLLFFGISFYSCPPKLDPDIEAVMEMISHVTC